MEVDDFFGNITDERQKIDMLNILKKTLHQHSPFSDEPVDCVLWVKSAELCPNDYNPNVMASPEKKLLQRSLETDGYTQPIVVTEYAKGYAIIDGFHRYSLGKSQPALRKRLNGYLPIALVTERSLKPAERIAATIRHNRARGKHQIAAMSAIVQDLYKMGWGDARISEELGMDADEVLRLKQIGGLAELFQDNEYNEAWTVK
ncbi:ParB/RepB/Spo0J family partition protein [Edwardsiella anguillarum]|nr:ParB/RepB/Spo0J family partition protein [Edwardsiella anguillarum]WHP82021.1 ParB/RepB/Spo0J family partition protein [Edwardsiella anguillarum]WHQ19553.1 ParB/RepB/Spo0J family partition protein [Edwardsiella anguillarum]WHQ23094.1 ParB/RepB/Spo0J family partition protein [Edwardsiella anguillarum]WHQ26620.1 ParB/RepB/Spo0J family partition protein [Edwardsiella anguillarum]WHQ30138.1 ParB/RepB/Spo0J family partition protein [Edwardsiella anguillarum]